MQKETENESLVHQSVGQFLESVTADPDFGFSGIESVPEKGEGRLVAILSPSRGRDR
jgi:hypothetical protein